MTNRSAVQSCRKEDILPLFEEYMLHMSRFHEVDDFESWHGRAMRYLDRYDHDADRSIFGLIENGCVIGFAMVNGDLRFNEEGMAMAEFHIEAKHQRTGRGRAFARSVFEKFPGRWEAAVAEGNSAAREFWRDTVRGCGGGCREVRIDGYAGVVFSFEVAGGRRTGSA